MKENKPVVNRTLLSPRQLILKVLGQKYAAFLCFLQSVKDRKLMKSSPLEKRIRERHRTRTPRFLTKKNGHGQVSTYSIAIF